MDIESLLLVLFGLALTVGMFLCTQAGLWAGRWRAKRLAAIEGGPAAVAGGTTAVDAAVFGLLGLLIAFTFSGASSRMESRRQLIIHESDAIGIAYLRIDLVPAEAQPKLRRLFRQYLEARLESHEFMFDQEALKREREELARIQGEIWSAAVDASKQAPGPAGILLLPAINQMIDIADNRYTAALIHAPVTVAVLLMCLSLLSAFLLGLALSARKSGTLLPSFLYSVAITLSLVVIMDLEFPRVGIVRLDVTDQAMVQLLELIK